MPQLGRPGPRPHLWKSGPDPDHHERYKAWLQQRNQAQFRGESWYLDFPTWCEIWGDRWPRRGRRRGDFCMTRRDRTRPWCQHNVEIMPRGLHARQQGQLRLQERSHAAI